MIRAVLGALRDRPLWVRLGLLAAGVLVALALPWVLYPPVATDIICWGLFAVALDLVLGYTGLLSFGHAAFWGTSCYVTGLVAIHTGLPFYLAVLGGACAAAVLAVPIGFLSVRRSGIYFAMVTLAFAQVVYFVANQWSDVTGGENGLQDIPRRLGGVDLSDSFVYYYFALPVVGLGLFAAWRVVHSPFGRVIVAVRDNPSRTRSLGYPVDRYRLVAFVLSAFLAGLAGGLYAEGHGFASLQEVYWTTSGSVVVMTVLGGIGTLWGALVGAAIVVRLEDLLATAGYEQVDLVTGLIFIVVVLLFRRGIWGTVRYVLARAAGPPGDGADAGDRRPHPEQAHDGPRSEALTP